MIHGIVSLIPSPSHLLLKSWEGLRIKLAIIVLKLKSLHLYTDELIQAIRNDISLANQRLEEVEIKKHITKFEEFIRTKL